MFDNLKNMQEMMRGMSPGDIANMVKQAGAVKAQMEEMVRQLVNEEIKKRGLLTREEVERMIEERMKNRES